jgi:multisubunit Na+/H+ antiporter MnhG subunit
MEMDRIFLAIIAGGLIMLVTALGFVRIPSELDANVASQTAIPHDDPRTRPR